MLPIERSHIEQDASLYQTSTAQTFVNFSWSLTKLWSSLGTSPTKRAPLPAEYRYTTVIARGTWRWRVEADLSESEEAQRRTWYLCTLVKSSQCFSDRNILRHNFKISKKLNCKNLEIMPTIMGDLSTSNNKTTCQNFCASGYKPCRRITKSDWFFMKEVKKSVSCGNVITTGATKTTDHLYVVELWSRSPPARTSITKGAADATNYFYVDKL